MILAVFVVFGSVIAVNSTSGEFSATSDTLNVNWVNNYQGNITLSTSTYVILDIHNASSAIMNSTSDQIPFSIYTWDGTQHKYTNKTILNSSSNYTTLIFDTINSAPGRYSGNLTITNSTNVSEKIDNFVVTVDVPIDVSSGTGSFSGNISNSTERYYFNASAVSDVVGINITLTSPSNTVYMELYNNNSVRENYHTFDQTESWAVSNETLYPLTGYWYFTMENLTSDSTFTGTVQLLKSSLKINNTLTNK